MEIKFDDEVVGFKLPAGIFQALAEAAKESPRRVHLTDLNGVPLVETDKDGISKATTRLRNGLEKFGRFSINVVGIYARVQVNQVPLKRRMQRSPKTVPPPVAPVATTPPTAPAAEVPAEKPVPTPAAEVPPTGKTPAAPPVKEVQKHKK